MRGVVRERRRDAGPQRRARLHPGGGLGTLPSMPAPRRRLDHAWLPTVVPTLHALLDRGDATRGLRVTVRGGQLLLGRVDPQGPDPRFRLTPLASQTFGLSLYRRKRWELLPYSGTLEELSEVMNTDLAHWAVDWSLPPAS